MTLESDGIKKILIATDFSAHAAAALKRGMDVAQLCQADVTVAHALTDIRSEMAAMSYDARWELVGGDIHKFQQELCRNSDAQLAEFLQPYADSATRVQKQTLVGSPFVEIIHAVQEQGHDLVMVGTRGAKGLQRLILGSTTQRLLRNCPAAVWAVKSEPTGPLKTILAATDLSEVSGRALRMAAYLTQRSGAALHIVHVVEDLDPETLTGVPENLLKHSKREINRAARQRLGEFIQTWVGNAPVAQSKIVWGKSWKSISDFSRRLQADLVVVGTVGRSGIPGMLMGNTAEKVLHTIRCDVLTVKPEGFISPIPTAIRVS